MEKENHEKTNKVKVDKKVLSILIVLVILLGGMCVYLSNVNNNDEDLEADNVSEYVELINESVEILNESIKINETINESIINITI